MEPFIGAVPNSGMDRQESTLPGASRANRFEPLGEEMVDPCEGVGRWPGHVLLPSLVGPAVLANRSGAAVLIFHRDGTLTPTLPCATSVGF